MNKTSLPFLLRSKSKTLLPIIVGVVIIIGAAGFFIMNRSASNPASPTGETMMGSENKSLRDLMKLTDNQECTFSDAESQSNGTIYGADGNVRGDFTTTSNGEILTSHIISDGETVYLWMDGEAQGFQMSYEAIESVQEESMSQAVDLDREVDHECKHWNADSSKFQLPSGVEFSDLGGMMDSMMEEDSNSSTTDNSAQCAACASLPAEAQAQCRQALNCN